MSSYTAMFWATGRSGRTASPSTLLRAILEIVGDPDREFLRRAETGLTLGILRGHRSGLALQEKAGSRTGARGRSSARRASWTHQRQSKRRRHSSPRGAHEPEPEGERTPGPPPATSDTPRRARRRRRGPEPLSGATRTSHVFEEQTSWRLDLPGNPARGYRTTFR